MMHVLLLILALWSQADSPKELRGKVVSISDGDTCTILVEREQVKIRLLGIDAPEKSQPFGTKAKEHIASLIHEKEARVVVAGKDRYGRTLGTIFIGETNVNAEMVRSGHAWHFKRYSKDKELARLEEEARTAKRGLWGGSEPPVEPWLWRKKAVKE